MRRFAIFSGGTLLLLLSLLWWAWGDTRDWPVTYNLPPDGDIHLVIHGRPWPGLMAMPGQGGDRPGRLAIYRGDAYCGWLPVGKMNDPMVRVEGNVVQVGVPEGPVLNLAECGR